MTCFGSTSETSTGIRLYSRDLYARLEAETGVSTGFKPVGLIEAAADADRLHEYRRVAAFQRHLGLEVEEIWPAGDVRPVPLGEDRRPARRLPRARRRPGQPGRPHPVARRAARRTSASASSRACGRRRARRRDGAVTGVRRSTVTGDAEIECEYVVNCTGMWARELGERSGWSIPNQAAEHYYLITDTIDGHRPERADLRGPRVVRLLPRGGRRDDGRPLRAARRRVVGRRHPARLRRSPRSSPTGTGWRPFLETAMARVPVTLEVGVRTFFCGPESFTPDLAPAVGEAPGIRNYFVAAGMNSVGVLSAGGLGRVLAHWIIAGLPDVDVTGFGRRPVPRRPARAGVPPRRGPPRSSAPCTPPTRRASSCTPRATRLLSPVHDRLVAQRRATCARSPAGRAPTGSPGRASTPEAEPTWGRAPWFEQWEAEHRAVREGVGLMDMSFMAKFRCHGTDAGAVLDHLSAGAVNGEPGWITYTQWLNDDGRIEADLTVIEARRRRVLGGRLRHRARPRRWRWLTRRVARPPTCSIERRHRATSRSSTSRARCRATCSPTLTDADLSTDGVPVPQRARDRGRRRARCCCVRITYLGELGYELYVPADRRARACTTRWRPAQRRAARSGSRRWRRCGWRRPTATSATTSTTPTARSRSGSASRVALDKPTSSASDAAAGAQGGDSRRPQRLVQVRLTDPEPLLYHAELVLRDGVVGRLRPRRVVRLDARRRRRAGIRRAPARRSPRTGSTPAPGRSTSPASGTPPRSRCARCTTRPAPACAADPRDVIRTVTYSDQNV